MSKEKYDRYDSYTTNELCGVSNQVFEPVDNSNFGRAIKHIKFLNSEFNRTMIRMVSVTDMVLQYQLQEEHNLIAALLNEETSKCYNTLFQDIVIDHKKQYLDQIKEVSFMDSLIYSCSKKKVSMDFNTMRIRIPASLQDRRLILIICHALNYTIHIHDLEGYVVDSIGSGSIDLSVYIIMFSRFDLYDSCSVYECCKYLKD